MYIMSTPPGGRDQDKTRTMKKSKNSFKAQALKRILIAEGHLKKVKKMLEKDDYCPDIIHQSRAVQGALKKVDEVVLHGHLHACVLNDIHGAKSEKIVTEVVDLFKKQ